MKWAMLMGISVIVFGMILFPMKRLKADQKKEKVAAVFLSLLGWGLAVLLVFFPDIPGPSEFVTAIFKPLENLVK